MAKGFEWKKKEGGDWYELKVDLPSLTLDQSLKVQEMFDNKNHQRLQEKFNKMIVVLTAIIVLNGVFSFVVVASEYFNYDLKKWLLIFGLAFFIASLSFVYITLPDKIKSILKIDKSRKNMEVTKRLLALIIFIAMTYVAFQVTTLFGIIFLLGGIYALVMHEAWERPGVPVLWLMGGLITRVAFTDMLLPILRYKTLIDIVAGLFAFGIVYLIGHKIKNS